MTVLGVAVLGVAVELRLDDGPGVRWHRGVAWRNAREVLALAGCTEALARAPANRPPLRATTQLFLRPSGPPNRDPNLGAAARVVVRDAGRTHHPRADVRFPRTGLDGDPADHGTVPTDRIAPPSPDVTDAVVATTVPVANPAKQSPHRRTQGKARTPPSIPQPPRNSARSWHPSGPESAACSRDGRLHCASASGKGCDAHNGDRPQASGAAGAAPDSCGECSPESDSGPH